MIMRKITRISRFTSQRWRIELDCGHKRTLTGAEVKQEQLFIGKATPCEECKEGNK